MQELTIPNWKQINIVEVETKLIVMLADHRARVSKLLASGPPYTWQNFIVPLEDMADELHMLWFPVVHLATVVVPQDSAVCKVERMVYKRCLKKLSKHSTWFMQNRSLYRGYKYLSDNRDSPELTSAQKMVIDNSMRAFRLSGVLLPRDKKKRVGQIDAQLSDLGKKFADNVVDSTSPKAWSKLIAGAADLDGVPPNILEGMSEAAKKEGHQGFLVTLGEATFAAVIENARNRDLRREVFEARITRASSRGPNAGKWDNAPIIGEVLDLGYELAPILGFSNYPELSIADKMAESTSQVLDFLNEIMSKAKPAALREYQELATYAKAHDSIDVLEPWDVHYYLKQVKEEKYAFSQEALSEYFSAPAVVSGAFTIMKHLYGVSFREHNGAELWHTDAKLLDVEDSAGTLIGGLYTDLYERPGAKNDGAWMWEVVLRRKLSDGRTQLPVGLLVTNFRPETTSEPSLLPIDDVQTALHELGHNMQLLLTEQTDLDVSGLNGVPRDGIELASQFMENFLWQRAGIDLIAQHYKTGEKIPEDLFQKIRAARTFGLGHEVVWLATRSLFDFRLFLEHNPANGCRANSLYQEVCEAAQPILVSAANYPWSPETFRHLFCDDYDVGYYGYLWANVLAADAFSAFIKDGKIDWSVGELFRREILSRGGSRPFMESFIAFRGRRPSVDHLLRMYGFIE